MGNRGLTRLARWPKGRRRNQKTEKSPNKKERRRKILWTKIGPILKGPKHEIFESGFLTQIRRLWLGDLGTGEKN
jgi:hypothetical protein